MKRIAVVAGIIVCVAPFASPGREPDGAAVAAARREARRDEIVASSALGADFTDGKRTWRVVSTLRARPESEVAGFEVVDQRGPLAVVVAGPSPAGGRPVAVDVRTGRLGILSGTIVVELVAGADPAVIARGAGLSVRFVAKGIGYAYLVGPAGRDLVEAAATVARQPGVVEAHPEVLTSFATGK